MDRQAKTVGQFLDQVDCQTRLSAYQTIEQKYDV